VVCADVEGLDWVRLRELKFNWGGPFHEVEIRRASDLLEALASKDRPIPARARMAHAKFQIKFTNAKTPRMLTIRPPITASFARDGDSVLGELWLTRRGFVVDQSKRKSVSSPTTLDETPHADQNIALV
jgi:hypothetical protein